MQQNQHEVILRQIDLDDFAMSDDAATTWKIEPRIASLIDMKGKVQIPAKLETRFKGMLTGFIVLRNDNEHWFQPDIETASSKLIPKIEYET